MTPVPEGWSDFFVATTGAAGALVGLIIVAMTVNITTIIGIPGMASRAGATIASLVLILVTSAAALIPRQDALFLGLEVCVFTLIVLGLTLDSGYRIFQAARRPGAVPGRPFPKAAVGLVQIVPFLVAAVALLSGDWSGLYWIATGILLVFIGSIVNAWVLLVEILR